MVKIVLFLVLIGITQVNGGRSTSVLPGSRPDVAVRGTISENLNQVIRSQMENVVAQYNDRKMTKGYFYDSLKRKATLKELKNDLKTEFQKTVAVTGRNLSNDFIGMKSDQSNKSAADSSKAGSGHNEKTRTPIRKNRLERVSKHYGKKFGTFEKQW